MYRDNTDLNWGNTQIRPRRTPKKNSGKVLGSRAGRCGLGKSVGAGGTPSPAAGCLPTSDRSGYAVPDDAQLVVFHSAVLNYVSRDRQQAFAEVLAKASKRRDVVWLAKRRRASFPS